MGSTANELFASLYTFRFLFMLIFTLAAAGFVIKILKQFRINYMFIFELDPQYKITHIQLFRVRIFAHLTIYRLRPYYSRFGPSA